MNSACCVVLCSFFLSKIIIFLNYKLSYSVCKICSGTSTAVCFFISKFYKNNYLCPPLVSWPGKMWDKNRGLFCRRKLSLGCSIILRLILIPKRRNFSFSRIHPDYRISFSRSGTSAQLSSLLKKSSSMLSLSSLSTK